jgi:hypothetical protein
MSARTRNRRRTALVITDDPDVNVQNLDLGYQYAMEPLEGGSMVEYGVAFPVQREEYRPMADVDYLHPTPVGDIHDEIDWEIGGVRGEINPVYSLGVVDSNTVENFWLDGRQQIVRRQGNPSQASGPVGTSDHNTLLGLAYAQQVNQYYPNERSQYDMIQAV